MIILLGQADGLLRRYPWRYSSTCTCCSRACSMDVSETEGRNLDAALEWSAGVRLRSSPAASASPGFGWAGAGAFSADTLLPAFRAAGFGRFVAIASASGLSARRAAERNYFEIAVPGADG